VPGTQYTAEQLTGTTQAVRSYAESATQAEKEKKYGQQKWGLFETNYQRNKGITTDESLKEIEVRLWCANTEAQEEVLKKRKEQRTMQRPSSECWFCLNFSVLRVGNV